MPDGRCGVLITDADVYEPVFVYSLVTVRLLRASKRRDRVCDGQHEQESGQQAEKK